MTELLAFYVVKNAQGKYYKSEGGDGIIWVNDIEDAKVYNTIGGARGRITCYTKNYPKLPIPKLIKLIVTREEEIDEAERVTKVIKKHKIAIAQRDNFWKKQAYEVAKKELEEAKAKIKELENAE
jgi:hypothetical protein